MAGYYGSESGVAAEIATGLGAASFVSAGLEAPTLGGDTPVTATLTAATGVAASASTTAALFSAGLNSYAGGGLSSFRGFAASEISSRFVAMKASKLPGIASAADFLSNLTGINWGKVAEAPPPCKNQ